MANNPGAWPTPICNNTCYACDCKSLHPNYITHSAELQVIPKPCSKLGKHIHYICNNFRALDKWTQSYHTVGQRIWICIHFKPTNHQVLIKYQQNWLKQGVEQLTVRFTNLLFLSEIRRNCLRSGRSQSLYLSIRMVIEQIVVIIEAYIFANYI